MDPLCGDIGGDGALLTLIISSSFSMFSEMSFGESMTAFGSPSSSDNPSPALSSCLTDTDDPDAGPLGEADWPRDSVSERMSLLEFSFL